MVNNYILLLFFSVAYCVYSAQTMDITGTLRLPNGADISMGSTISPIAGIEITLNGHQFKTYTRSDGSFTFPNVPSGVYLLDVHSLHDIFSQLKIKVNAETDTIKVAEYKYTGGKRFIADYPIDLVALSAVTYFHQRPPISIKSMLFGNPMMIMMVVSIGVILLFPMLMSGLSEEEIAEIQKSNHQPLQQLQSMLGVAPKAGDDDD